MPDTPIILFADDIALRSSLNVAVYPVSATREAVLTHGQLFLNPFWTDQLPTPASAEDWFNDGGPGLNSILLLPDGTFWEPDFPDIKTTSLTPYTFEPGVQEQLDMTGVEKFFREYPPVTA